MGVPVARRNLFAEKGRFAISIAGVGFADQRIREVADRVLWLEDGRIKDIGSLVLDPVCGMSVEQQNAAASLEHGGHMYYFSSRGCSWEFNEAPERFSQPTPEVNNS